MLFTAAELAFLNDLACKMSKMGALARRGNALASQREKVLTETAQLPGIVYASPLCAADVSHAGPRGACKRLRADNWSDQQRAGWIEQARHSAILGSCPRSRNSVVSGIRCYLAFADQCLKCKGQEFPPTTAGLLAWSSLFRCAGTFQNYVNYVRIGCDLLGVSPAACSDPAVRRAAIAIAKRRQFQQRQKHFIRGRTVGSHC